MSTWTTFVAGELKVGDTVEYEYHDNMRGVKSRGGVVVINYTPGGRPVILVADDSDCTVRLALFARKTEI